jgi:1-acyl-sn-glycerol-3-phosphate acyltransferase
MFYGFANLVLRLLFYLLTRLEVTGKENVPHSGSLMVAMNHVNFLDPLLLGAVIPRRIWWMSKIENWNNPIMGTVLTLYGAFPVQRGEVDRKALVRAMDILRTGGALGSLRKDTGPGRAFWPGPSLARPDWRCRQMRRFCRWVS